MNLYIEFDHFKNPPWYECGRVKTMSSWEQSIQKLQAVWTERYAHQMSLKTEVDYVGWEKDLSSCLDQMQLKVWMGRQSFKERVNPLGYFSEQERFGSYIDQYALGFDCARGWIKKSDKDRLLQKQSTLNICLDLRDASVVQEQLRKTFLYLGACHVQLPFIHSEIIINAASASVLRTLSSFVGAGSGEKEKAQQLALLHEMGHSVQSQMRNAGFFWELLPWDQNEQMHSYTDNNRDAKAPLDPCNDTNSAGNWSEDPNWLRLCSLIWGFLRTYEKNSSSLLFAFNWLRESHADVLSILWYAHLWKCDRQQVRQLLKDRITARREHANQIARMAFLGVGEHETHGALKVLEQRFENGLLDYSSDSWSMLRIMKEAQICALAGLRLRCMQVQGSQMDPVIERKIQELQAACQFLDLWWVDRKGLCDQLWSNRPLEWVDSPGLVAKKRKEQKTLNEFEKQNKEDKISLIRSIKNLSANRVQVGKKWFESNQIDERALSHVFK